ncbi:uncharacterized protein LOC135495989 [Lineus longissimus]|uniref:uncharacterized protein LOC135495989 n=1 Tax=Lineus longissimus TaxID=88925 RepID=UPI002B4DE186
MASRSHVPVLVCISAVILTALIPVTAESSWGSCGNGCVCDKARLTITCRLSSLATVAFPADTRKIIARDNGLSSIPTNVFQGLDDIDEINLINNRITSLRGNTFAGANNLRKLFLGSNSITSIDEGTFAKMTRLSELDLSGNPNMGSIPPGVFSGCTLLREINLSNCGLRSLSEDVLPRRLRALDLSGNVGIQVTKKMFDKVGRNVLKINMANCKANLKMDFFQVAKRLKSLDLSGNTVLAKVSSVRSAEMCIDGSCYRKCGGGEFNDLNKPHNELLASSEPKLFGLFVDLNYVTQFYQGQKTSITLYADTVLALDDVTLDSRYQVRVITRNFYVRHGKQLRGATDCQFSYAASRAGKKRLIIAKFGPLVVLTDNIDYDKSCAYDRGLSSSGMVPSPDVLQAMIQCAEMNRADSSTVEATSLPMLASVVTLASAPGTSAVTELRNVRNEASKALFDIDVELRSESRIVPYLSLDAYTNILTNLHTYGKNYEDQYTAVEARQDRLVNQEMEFRALTVQANGLRESAVQDNEASHYALQVSQIALERFKASYDEARLEMKEAKEAFERGVEKYKRDMAMKTAFAFIKAIFSIITGAAARDPSAIMDGITQLIDAMMELVDLIVKITNLMRGLDAITATLGENGPNTDVSVYLQDVEEAAGLRVKMVEWDNMIAMTDTQLDTDTVREIGASTTFREAVKKLANYGKSMTQQLITQSSLVIEAYQKKLRMDLAEEYLVRVETDFQLLGNKAVQNAQVLWSLKMQKHQAKMLLMEHLLQYCRTYFYFMLKNCAQSEMPEIGDTMHNLLGKISIAKTKKLLNMVRLGTSQSMNERVSLVDTKFGAACKFDHDCPVTRMKQNRILALNITRDNDDDFYQYERVRVEEIKVLLKGVTNRNRRDIKLVVQNTGDFDDFYQGNEYNFLSVPFNRIFKYSTADGSSIDEISTRANDVNQRIFMSTTPFTIWRLWLPLDDNQGIDLSGLSEVKIYFIGNMIAASRSENPFWDYGGGNFGPYGRRKKRSVLKVSMSSF